MDIIFIHGLHIDTIIGIYEWERNIKQTLSFDIEMATDIRQAAATDDIQFSVNYKAVSDRVIDYVINRNALLIEALGEEIAQIIRSEFNVAWLRLRISKPGAVRDARDVGLVIERGVKPA